MARTIGFDRLIDLINLRNSVMSTQPEERRRFRNRRLTQLLDIVQPFESQPSSNHIRNAMGVIERLRDEGRQFWEPDSAQLDRWCEGCTELWVFLNNLGKRRDLDKQPLEIAFREFVQTFEHTVYRMKQMLHGLGRGVELDPPEVDAVFRWIELAYRLSTYGLVSHWIDDKTEARITNMTLSLTTGEWSEGTEVVKEMRIPKKYQPSARLGS